MHASIAQTLSRLLPTAMTGAWLAFGVPAAASANVITDWDEKAVAAVAPLQSLGGTMPYMDGDGHQA